MPVTTRPPTTPNVGRSARASRHAGRSAGWRPSSTVLALVGVLDLDPVGRTEQEQPGSGRRPTLVGDDSPTAASAALKAIDALPPAVDTHSAVARAAVVDQATTILDRLVDRIEADAPHTGDDAVRFRGWIRDWRTYLRDRRDYTRRLRATRGPRLLLDVNKAGDSVDRAITNFADINDIPACDAPGDVS